MSTLAKTHPTLLDMTKAQDVGGNIAHVCEILNQTNEVLDDMVMVQGNLQTGHKSVIRSGLPEPTWRKLYGGVQPSKSERVQVTDTTGMLEAYAEVDKALADLGDNAKAFRLSEDRAHIEGMSQEMARTLFYGDEETNDAAFTGLAARFNERNPDKAENAKNILAPNPVGSDNTSIWLVVWGPNTVHGIYPKGSKLGLMQEDKGAVTSQKPDGSMLEVYRSHYKWDLGLANPDWRYVVRIQVNVNELKNDASSGADLVSLCYEALDLVPNVNAGRAVFYSNRTVRGTLRQQIMNKAINSTLSINEITRPNGARVSVPALDGVNFRLCDALLNTEEAIPST